MKRIGMKIISMIVAVIMLVGLLPAMGQVAYAAGPWTITVHLNGGTGVENGTVDDGEYWTYSPPTKEGYTFAGWYTDPSLDSYHYWNNGAVHENLELYAKWWENITSVSASITLPVAGQHPDLSTKTAGDSSYLITHLGMSYIDSSYIPHSIDESYTFATGDKIDISIAFGPVDYNSYDIPITANATINDKAASFSNQIGDQYRSKVFHFIYTVPVSFSTQPTGGNIENDNKFDYNWECNGTPDSAHLEIKDGDSWTNLGPDSKSTPAYADISHVFRVAVVFGDNTYYSDEFTVTWAAEAGENKFTTQPQDATLEPDEDYNVTWALNFVPTGVNIQRNKDGEWTHVVGATATGGTIDGLADGTSRTYRVVAWNSDGTAYSDEFTVTWTNSSTTTYTVTVTNDGYGTGSASPTSGTTGTEVTLIATPNSGYQFKEWQVVSGGITVSGDKFEIGTANVEVKAIFEIIPASTYSVTVTNDGNGTGTASPASGITGTEVTLIATPNSGYKFKEWQVVSGDITVSSDKFKIGTANVEVKAIFEKLPASTYSVTVTNDGNGTGAASPTSGTTGTEVTLTATPNSGYKFKEWQVVSGGVTISGDKFKIGTANVEIKAIFEKKTEPAPGPEPSPGPEPEPTPGPEPKPEPKPTPAAEYHHEHNYVWQVTRQATPAVDGEMIYTCKECGAVAQRLPISGYAAFNEDAANKIKNAKPGAEVVISTQKWISFYSVAWNELAKRPDVKLVIDYQDKGKMYEVVIPAGTDVKSLMNSEGYAGFLFLSGKFGRHEIKVY